ncbi:MAG: tetratricopeptide repeat protein [Burkholderiales bacterium]
MKLRFLSAVLLVLACAHARADDANGCANAKDGDTVIAACTRAIESGRWQGADLARVYYNRALELDPRHVSAYNNRGAAKRTKGDFDGAIADYDRALELDPRSAVAHRVRGHSRYDKAEFALATADLARAQELKPDT